MPEELAASSGQEREQRHREHGRKRRRQPDLARVERDQPLEGDQPAQALEHSGARTRHALGSLHLEPGQQQQRQQARGREAEQSLPQGARPAWPRLRSPSVTPARSDPRPSRPTKRAAAAQKYSHSSSAAIAAEPPSPSLPRRRIQRPSASNRGTAANARL